MKISNLIKMGYLEDLSLEKEWWDEHGGDVEMLRAELKKYQGMKTLSESALKIGEARAEAPTSPGMQMWKQLDDQITKTIAQLKSALANVPYSESE